MATSSYRKLLYLKCQPFVIAVREFNMHITVACSQTKTIRTCKHVNKNVLHMFLSLMSEQQTPSQKAHLLLISISMLEHRLI